MMAKRSKFQQTHHSLGTVALQAIDLACAENVSPVEIHDLFMDRAYVYEATQKPMLAFVDHLHAATVHLHDKSASKCCHLVHQ